MRQEKHLGHYINELSDGRFHIVKDGAEVGSSVSMRLARERIEELLLDADVAKMHPLDVSVCHCGQPLDDHDWSHSPREWKHYDNEQDQIHKGA